MPVSEIASSEYIGDSLVKINSNFALLQGALDGMQAFDPDLTAIAALTGTGVLRRIGADTWAVGAIGISDVTDLQSVLDGKQSLNANLTSISAISGFGVISRASNGMWSAGSIAVDSVTGLQGLLDGKQPLDTDLTALAGLTGTGILKRTGEAGWTTLSTLAISDTDNLQVSLNAKQPINANLNAISGLGTTGYAERLSDGSWQLSTPPGGVTLPIAISDVTNLQPSLDGKQPIDIDLTAISGLDTVGVVKRTGSGTWSAGSILVSDVTGLQSSLDGKQPIDADLIAISELTGDGYLSKTAGGTWQFLSSSSGGAAWGDLTGTLSSQTDLQSALDDKQPENAELTAITGISTLGFVKRTATGTWSATSISISDVNSLQPALDGKQAVNTELTALSGLSGTGYAKRETNGSWSLDTLSGGGGGIWGSITGTLSSQTDLQSALDDKQASSGELTAIAGLTGTGIAKRVGSGSWSVGAVAISDVTNLQTLLDGKQTLDSDLTSIAALTGSGLLQRASDGTWSLGSSVNLTPESRYFRSGIVAASLDDFITYSGSGLNLGIMSNTILTVAEGFNVNGGMIDTRYTFASSGTWILPANSTSYLWVNKTGTCGVSTRKCLIKNDTNIYSMDQVIPGIASSPQGTTISVSNNRRVATGGASQHSVVMIPSTTDFPLANRPKVYAEFLCTNIGGSSDWSIGVASSSASAEIPMWSLTPGITYYLDGRILVNGLDTITVSPISVGNIIGVCLDRSTGKVWFSRNGTWLNSGNPGADINPIATITPSSLAFRSTLSGSSSLTVQPFLIYPPPAGFNTLMDGTHMYSPRLGLMRELVSGSWVDRDRTFVGNAVTGASSVTSFNCYPILGRKTIRPFITAANTDQVINTGMGSEFTVVNPIYPIGSSGRILEVSSDSIVVNCSVVGNASFVLDRGY